MLEESRVRGEVEDRASFIRLTAGLINTVKYELASLFINKFELVTPVVPCFKMIFLFFFQAVFKEQGHPQW